MPNKNDCVFCKIINGELPAERVYEDERVLSILDIAPANKGHLLVIPKKHYKTIIEMPEEELFAMISIVKKVGKSLFDALHADSFNVHINTGRAAGQLVEHAHIHIIPRFKDDELSFNYDAKKYEPMEMKNIATRIRKAMR
jgi:histidine triad (HIT) family protein